jgi:phosphate-selective porin OprO/OprP
MGMTDLPMQERAMSSDALLPSRNTGLVMAGNLFNNRVSLAGGVFNDFLDKEQPSSPSNNSTQVVGRLTWVPYKSENESTLLHLGVGLRKANIREGASISTEPEINLAPLYIDTGFIDPTQLDESDNINLEASFRSGPFRLHAEYNQANLHAPALLDPEVVGYHVTLSWIATGEVRQYNPNNATFKGVPISRSVKHDGWGAWEYSIRYSTLDATDGPLSGGEADVWSLGVNWWLTDLMNVYINYRYIDLERKNLRGKSSAFTSRILLMLE